MGNLLMDRFAQLAPLSIVQRAGHVLFWPIAVSQYAMFRFGLIDWYSEITRTENGGKLILGGLPWPAYTRRLLFEKEKVNAILNLVSETRPSQFDPNVVVQKHVPMTDFVHPFSEDVKSGVCFIDDQLKQGKTVYVHCRAGKGRSATVVMCWLVSRMGMTPETAQWFLEKKRPQVLSNLKNREVVKQFANITQDTKA
jgi:protein-tyrosine phosphatase